MQHVAIDLGGKESQVCVRESDGKIVLEQRMKTVALGGWLKTRSKSRVIVETCSEALRVADAARSADHEVRVVPSTLCPSLLVGARGKKTDVDDARALSLASCRIDLPSIHVPSEKARDLKAELTSRTALVSTRRNLINTVRGYLRTQGWSVGKGATDTFAARVRKQSERRNAPLPTHIQALLTVVDLVCTQIAAADAQALQAVKQDPTCTLLMTVPGVGPMVALGMLSTVDDVTRFPDAHHLASYVGMVPSEHSSSERKRRGGITKAGSSRLRWLMVQAAWCAWRNRPRDPMVLWAKQVAQRRGERVAITALGRKLLGILLAIWRSGKPYDPARGSSVTSALATVQEGLAMLPT